MDVLTSNLYNAQIYNEFTNIVKDHQEYEVYI